MEFVHSQYVCAKGTCFTIMISCCFLPPPSFRACVLVLAAKQTVLLDGVKGAGLINMGAGIRITLAGKQPAIE